MFLQIKPHTLCVNCNVLLVTHNTLHINWNVLPSKHHSLNVKCFVLQIKPCRLGLYPFNGADNGSLNGPLNGLPAWTLQWILNGWRVMAMAHGSRLVAHDLRSPRTKFCFSCRQEPRALSHEPWAMSHVMAHWAMNRGATKLRGISLIAYQLSSALSILCISY